MAEKDLKVQDLVWAKMKGYPPWPAIIAPPNPQIKSPISKNPQHFVYFFGSRDFAWIKEKNIYPHTEDLLQASKLYTKPSKTLKDAIQEITEAALDVETNNEDESSLQLPPVQSPEVSNDLFEFDTEIPMSVSESEKITKKRPSEENEISEVPAPKINKIDIHSLPCMKHPKNVTIRQLEGRPFKTFCPETIPEYFKRSMSPPMDLTSVSQTLMAKGIAKTTDKKIGFIGLGRIGQAIVKILLHSKHHVTVWNKSPEKCDDFVLIGAHRAASAADVVIKSDIIICCVSDPEAAKSVVFGSKGIIKGLECSEPSKGFLEMSSVDPITSQEMSEAIQGKGGRYLEVPVSGSKYQAEDGLLLVMAAGDRSLFDDCKPIFPLFAKHAFFVSYVVGNACRMKLILNSFMGVTFGALAEAMTLVDSLHLSESHFLEVMSQSPVMIPAVLEKGRRMKARTFPTNTPLKHQQKDLRLTLEVGNSVDQPMFVTSAANQVYKRAKALRYEEHDISAVIFGTRY